MSAKILYGKEFAAKIKESAREQVEELKSKFGVTPGLTVLGGACSKKNLGDGEQ